MIRTWSLDVSDNASGLVVHEFDTDLGNTTTGTCDRQLLGSFAEILREVSARSDRDDEVGNIVPVRPRTRVTLTSLTGCLADSISAIYDVWLDWDFVGVLKNGGRTCC